MVSKRVNPESQCSVFPCMLCLCHSPVSKRRAPTIADKQTIFKSHHTRVTHLIFINISESSWSYFPQTCRRNFGQRTDLISLTNRQNQLLQAHRRSLNEDDYSLSLFTHRNSDQWLWRSPQAPKDQSLSTCFTPFHNVLFFIIFFVEFQWVWLLFFWVFFMLEWGIVCLG